MADADLDVVIRRLAKQQNKDIMAAAKRRRDHYAGLAAKAKDSAAKEKYRQIARATLMQGSAAAKRLQLAADNAADSYARSIRNAAQEAAAKKPVEKPVKKSTEKPTKKKAKAPAS
jgi:ribosomal protein S21